MFDNTSELIKYCNKNNMKVSQAALEREMKKSNLSEETILNNLKELLKVMEKSSNEGLNKNMKSNGGLIGSEAKKIEKYRQNKSSLSGDLLLSAAAMAYSTSQVNACMGKIVAAPTAGAAGILPASILAAKKKFNLEEKEVLNILLTSAEVGRIIATKASISGAEGGCQAECGSAAAMAAAGLTEALGGSPEQVFHAASIALSNIMGLICDPVAGLVEYPCALRNASGVANAFLSADLALAGVESIIPFDQVVQAMKEVGDIMHTSLKETALGGLATTEKGLHIRKKLGI